jgi:hypothetical protein
MPFARERWDAKFPWSDPRAAESGLGLLNVHAYSAPYEDVGLKAK